MGYVYILIIAIILDFILGDPPQIPHPIRYIGKTIKVYENMIRKQKNINLKFGGFMLLILSLITVMLVVSLIIYVSKEIHQYLNIIISVYLTYTALAAKCLSIETKKVYKALKNNDLKESRKMLSYLVGRDTTNLSKKEVIRGTVETIAENTIDGILAPIFFFVIGIVFNAPIQMIFLYKTINTLDSMVGYIQEPYKEIGFASAKVDDLANYIPARVGSIFMLIAGGLIGYDFKNGYKILKRDRRNHKSPNCGYPESAVAGLLKIQLGGTNTYFGQRLYKPTMGDSIEDLKSENIIDTIKIMYGSEIIMAGTFILGLLYIFKLS